MRVKYNKDRVDALLKQPRGEENVEELIILNYGLMNRQMGKFFMHNNPDALSVAYEALYNAIMTFDTEKNNRFSTYASVCIYNGLGSYARSKKDKPIDISYDASTENYSLLEILESGDTADGRTLVGNGISNIEKAVQLALEEFSNPLHRSIAEAWSTSEFELTHVKIAKGAGCSQSYVSQIIKRFRKAIKNKLEEINNA